MYLWYMWHCWGIVRALYLCICGICGIVRAFYLCICGIFVIVRAKFILLGHSVNMGLSPLFPRCRHCFKVLALKIDGEWLVSTRRHF